MRITPESHLDHGNDPILGFRLAGIQRRYKNWLGVPSSGNPQSNKERIDDAAKCTLLAYSGCFCTVSDTIGTLSGIASLPHTDWDRFCLKVRIHCTRADSGTLF
jgi:hypothetical protein